MNKKKETLMAFVNSVKNRAGGVSQAVRVPE
jgi:hypothetical protein